MSIPCKRSTESARSAPPWGHGLGALSQRSTTDCTTPRRLLVSMLPSLPRPRLPRHLLKFGMHMTGGTLPGRQSSVAPSFDVMSVLLCCRCTIQMTTLRLGSDRDSLFLDCRSVTSSDLDRALHLSTPSACGTSVVALDLVSQYGVVPKLSWKESRRA